MLSCFVPKKSRIGKIAAHSAYEMFSLYQYLIVSLVFSHLGFWSGNLFLIAPFPDLCLLVPSTPNNVSESITIQVFTRGIRSYMNILPVSYIPENDLSLNLRYSEPPNSHSMEICPKVKEILKKVNSFSEEEFWIFSILVILRG